MSFRLTAKQRAALTLLGGPATHCLLYGGSRSGKTFLNTRATVIRALAAAKSRHAVLRFRFNHVKAAVVMDTFPKVMDLCFPKVKYEIDRTDWFAWLPGDSQIWFGGLDDKIRAEKILGQEHATIFLNECSQIPYSSRNLAVTRLAQNVNWKLQGKTGRMRLKMLYDCNPPPKGHWLYQLFFQHRDPDSKEPLLDPENYAALQINPDDNADNLADGYLASLDALPARLRLRFRRGEFGEVAEGALWTLEGIETYRELGTLPDMQRIVIAVDPSGSGDEDNASNDEIGIVVAGLGMDGNGYLLEDLTCKAGPAVWGNVATTAYDRHRADCIVGEVNYGGAMVEHVIQTSRRRTPYRKVTASRGKAVRAEPVAALAEKGQIRHAGYFPDLEDELTSFTVNGFRGAKSPNRADAYVWAFTELFHGIVAGPRDSKVSVRKPRYMMTGQSGAWMGV